MEAVAELKQEQQTTNGEDVDGMFSCTSNSYNSDPNTTKLRQQLLDLEDPISFPKAETPENAEEEKHPSNFSAHETTNTNQIIHNFEEIMPCSSLEQLNFQCATPVGAKGKKTDKQETAQQAEQRRLMARMRAMRYRERKRNLSVATLGSPPAVEPVETNVFVKMEMTSEEMPLDPLQFLSDDMPTVKEEPCDVDYLRIEVAEGDAEMDPLVNDIIKVEGTRIESENYPNFNDCSVDFSKTLSFSDNDSGFMRGLQTEGTHYDHNDGTNLANKRKQSETEEQASERRRKCAQRMRDRRARETPEELEARREKMRINIRKNRLKNEEDACERRRKNAQSQRERRKRRANETPAKHEEGRRGQMRMAKMNGIMITDTEEDALERRRKAAERQRRFRAKETPADVKARLEKLRIAQKNRYKLRKTDEERRRKDAQRSRDYRAKETAAESEARRLQMRINKMKTRLKAQLVCSEDQLQEARDRHANEMRLARKKRLENETPEQTAERKHRQNGQWFRKRSRLEAMETPEETAARKKADAEKHMKRIIAKRERETPEEREARKARNRQYQKEFQKRAQERKLAIAKANEPSSTEMSKAVTVTSTSTKLGTIPQPLSESTISQTVNM